MTEEELDAIVEDATDILELPSEFKDGLEQADDTHHDGLFADLPRSASPPDLPASKPPIPTVSNRPGRRTSNSMLARLQKRKENGEDSEAFEETQGSGYIRLPTAEIHKVLGRGAYRLRIETVVYEPVDKDGLTQLIKGGVLLGAEEIAEADGDWMPVSEHPVFDELRRKMAAEAHLLLSKFSQGRKEASSRPEANQPDGSVSELNVDSEALAQVTQELDEILDATGELLPGQHDEDAPKPPVPRLPVPKPPALKPPVPKPSALKPPVPKPPVPKVVVAKVEDPVQESEVPPKKSRKGLFIGIAVVVIGGIVAVVVGGTDFLSTLSSSPVPADGVAAVADEPPPVPGLADAVGAAHSQVNAALPLALANPDEHLAWARERLSQGDAESAAVVLGAHWDGEDREAVFEPYTQALLGAGQYQRVRELSLEAMSHDALKAQAEATFKKGIADDGLIGSTEPLLISRETGHRLVDVQVVRGVHQLIVETDDGRFAFKPTQPDFSDWRSELAAYRLCELVLCHFQIPTTLYARLDKSELDAHSGNLEGPWSWQESSSGTSFIEGSLQALVEETSPWPIEIVSTWRDWLTLAGAMESLDEPTRMLARQVSDILVFDFLTNNWTRFSSNRERFGENSLVADGTIFSIHNGDTFQPRASQRVQGRFEWTSRFSRTMVHAIRGLEPDVVNEILFPS
ncbi:MAG: hypothetical protein ACNA8W_21130, partial [Bradymonadaceae bacterium]